MARVLLTREARAQLEALSSPLRDVVENALTYIEADPNEAGKELLGRLRGIRSARVGNYRILYTVEGAKRSPRVIVRAIRHRAVAYPSSRRRR